MTNLLPACATFFGELAAWWLAARRIRGIVSGTSTLHYVLLDVVVSYGILSAFVTAQGGERWLVVLAALAGAGLGWAVGNRPRKKGQA